MTGYEIRPGQGLPSRNEKRNMCDYLNPIRFQIHFNGKQLEFLQEKQDYSLKFLTADII